MKCRTTTLPRRESRLKVRPSASSSVNWGASLSIGWKYFSRSRNSCPSSSTECARAKGMAAAVSTAVASAANSRRSIMSPSRWRWPLAAGAVTAVAKRTVPLWQEPTSCPPLDRGADEIAPLRPGAVVVLHVRIAEQVLEHEPGVTGALADAAVGDHRPVRRDALALIE